MRNWVEVRIKVTDETGDAISSFLFENNSTGLVIEGDYFLSYFIDENFDMSVSEKLSLYLINLRNLGFKNQPAEFTVKSIKDRDWNRFWKKDLKPIEITENILVVPSWIKKHPAKYKIVLKIDPGLAFGSGYHETTKIAAVLLEKHISGKSGMLDAGTGTGILAILACKMGIENITALDNYPLSIEVCSENLKLNNIPEKEISLVQSDLTDFNEGKFDLITANIDYKVLSKNMRHIAELTTENGIIIFSGIMKSNKKDFINVIRENNLNIIDKYVIGDWIGFVSENA